MFTLNSIEVHLSLCSNKKKSWIIFMTQDLICFINSMRLLL